MIYIVGIGPGNVDYITTKAVRILKECDAVVGFSRALESLDFVEEDKKFVIKTLSDVNKYIINEERKSNNLEFNNIAISASGDPIFYGITNYIKSKTDLDFEIVPGISSFQYLMSKLKLPWNNAHLGSLHGRSEDFIDIVKKYKLTIWLTDKENNPSVLCQKLMNENITAIVIVGENLSYEDEKITIGSPGKFINKEFSGLNILVINQE